MNFNPFDDITDIRKNHTYQHKTHDIVVTLQPVFMPNHSNISQCVYVWFYFVNIENCSNETYQLLGRHWCITDDHAQTSEIKGKGVAGEQPILEPGDFYEYTSAVPLQTPSGFMTGYYVVENKDHQLLEIKIPTFSLDSPYINQNLQ